jgi:hypothetical protein
MPELEKKNNPLELEAAPASRRYLRQADFE